LATSIPEAVAEPHNQSPYAIVENIGKPHHQSSINAHDEESARVEEPAFDPDYPEPSDEERSSLRKVADHIPTVTFALCIVEFAERASYYGVQSVFSNFMQFPLPDGGNGAGAPPVGTEETAGALNEGLQFSNAFVLLFTFLAYVIPFLGAWVADTRIGRYKTIAIGVLICGVAHIILIVGAIPSILQAGNAIAPFMIGLFVLAFGAGTFLSKLHV
jgi:dipeptide/tripeptide permease